MSSALSRAIRILVNSSGSTIRVEAIRTPSTWRADWRACPTASEGLEDGVLKSSVTTEFTLHRSKAVPKIGRPGIVGLVERLVPKTVTPCSEW